MHVGHHLLKTKWSSFLHHIHHLKCIVKIFGPYHSSSKGLGEKAVQDIKNVLKRQMGKYNIDKLMAEYNSVARTGMDESPADLFFNRVVRSTMLGSGRRNLEFERAQQK